MSLICSLSKPAHQNWECLACGDQGEEFDLITHKNAKIQCLFHRLCYPTSMSGRSGICQGCGLFLHDNLDTLYVLSDSDTYRLPDFARCFRAIQVAKQKKTPFEEDEMKRMVRHASWFGDRKKASVEDEFFVKECVKPVFEKERQRGFRKQTAV